MYSKFQEKKSLQKAWFYRLIIVATLIFSNGLVSGCNKPFRSENISVVASTLNADFGAEQPKSWGENLPGIVRYLDYSPAERKIALTLDACGSPQDGYDWELIDFLNAENIPATLFINARWIDKNPESFNALANTHLFDIQNHGQNHLPASVNGRSAYGLKGTADIGALIEEVDANKLKIASLTGVEPTYYRSGTAYYDEVAVKVILRLKQKIAGFSVLGDAGATYAAAQIEQTLSLVQPNDVIIAHMNHPERQTAEGLIPALRKLKNQGYIFVTLREAKTRDNPPEGYKLLERNLSLDINVHPLESEIHKLRAR